MRSVIGAPKRQFVLESRLKATMKTLIQQEDETGHVLDDKFLPAARRPLTRYLPTSTISFRTVFRRPSSLPMLPPGVARIACLFVDRNARHEQDVAQRRALGDHLL